jgi:hypothetical protein
MLDLSCRQLSAPPNHLAFLSDRNKLLLGAYPALVLARRVRDIGLSGRRLLVEYSVADPPFLRRRAGSIHPRW